jgi:hypothetical protein
MVASVGEGGDASGGIASEAVGSIFAVTFCSGNVADGTEVARPSAEVGTVSAVGVVVVVGWSVELEGSAVGRSGSTAAGVGVDSVGVVVCTESTEVDLGWVESEGVGKEG